MPSPMQQQVEGVAAATGESQHFVPLVDLQHLQSISAGNMSHMSSLTKCAQQTALADG